MGLSGIERDAVERCAAEPMLDQVLAWSAVNSGSRNLHVRVRPEAPVQLLLTGHMDTVFGPEHSFQSTAWIDENEALGGPGVADMKGGIAVMLAALKALEASPAADR